MFSFKKDPLGYLICSNNNTNIIQSAIYENDSMRTEVFTRDGRTYSSLRETEMCNFDRPGISKEIRAITKLIQSNLE